jgi:hypothetical protein
VIAAIIKLSSLNEPTKEKGKKQHTETQKQTTEEADLCIQK